MEGERREPQLQNKRLALEDVLAVFAKSDEFGGAIRELRARHDPLVREAVFLGMLDHYDAYLQAQPDPDDVPFAHANRTMLFMAAEGANQRQINAFLYEYGYTDSRNSSVDVRESLIEQLSAVISVPAFNERRQLQDEKFVLRDIFADQPLHVLVDAVALLTGAQPGERTALTEFMTSESRPAISLTLRSGLKRLQRAYGLYAEYAERQIFTDTDRADVLLLRIANEKRQKIHTQKAFMSLVFAGEPPQVIARRANGGGEVAHDILQNGFFGLLDYAVERQKIDARKLAAALGLQTTEDSV